MENLTNSLENSLNFNIFTFEIISDQQSKIERQSQEIAELEKQVSWFKQQFKLASQRQFGKSSETSSSINLSMFDEKMDNKNVAADAKLKQSLIREKRKKQ
jgi:hypothetical protein